MCPRGGRDVAGPAGSGHSAHCGPPTSRHRGARAIPGGVRTTGLLSPLLRLKARPTLVLRKNLVPPASYRLSSCLLIASRIPAMRRSSPRPVSLGSDESLRDSVRAESHSGKAQWRHHVHSAYPSMRTTEPLKDDGRGFIEPQHRDPSIAVQRLQQSPIGFDLLCHRPRPCQIRHPTPHLLSTDDRCHHLFRRQEGKTRTQGRCTWLLMPLQHTQMIGV